MAYYSTKYKFAFDSVNGIKYEILIQQESYAGAVIERNLGSSPILRKDSNGSICGTSLEIPAECIVDGEYSEFYTANPYEYKVILTSNGAFLWQGFLTTEIYREPDIAPPYDVNLTATDGLGELKNDIFDIDGEESIHNILTNLLAKTGLSLRIDYVSDLQTASPSVTSRVSLFQQLKTDLGHLNGKTYYDVLQQLMDTLHATITQLNGIWVVMRETDAVVTSEGVAAYRVTTSTPEYLPVASFGTMNGHEWWPVGNMTNDVRPAKNRMVITSPNHYRQALKNPEMQSSSNWVMSNATYDTTEHFFRLPANTTSGIWQAVDFGRVVSTPLLLNLRASAVGSGTGESTIKLFIKKEHQGSSSYLTNKADRNGNEGTYRWSNSSSDYVTLKLSSPETGRIDSFDVLIPLFRRTSRDYEYADSIMVTVEQISDGLDKYIYGCSLVVNEQLGGYENVISLNNGARGEGDNIEIAFARSTQIDKAGFFLYGLPFVGDSDVEATFKSGSIASAMDYLSFITRDYALSYALPRLAISGTLNVGGSKCPVGFIDSNGGKYLLQTMSWNLRNDDMDVEMLSLPAASISVNSEDTTAVPGTVQSNGGGSSAGGSSSGGASEPYVLPKATETSLGGVAVGYFPQGSNLTVEIDSYGNIYVPLTSSAITAALGYTPGTGSGSGSTNPYVLPAATSSALGGVKIGYTASGANVPLKLSNQKAYVTLSSSAIISALGYTPAEEGSGGGAIAAATSSALGGIKIGYSATGANVPVQLSQERAYVQITRAAIVAALGFVPADEDDIGQGGGGSHEVIDRTAPRLRITKGEAYNSREFETLRIEHPDTSKAGAELVLMVYTKRTGARRYRTTSDWYRRVSKKWCVAMGEDGDRQLVLTSGMEMNVIRDYMVCEYMCDGNSSRPQMRSKSYNTWLRNIGSSINAGFGMRHNSSWMGKHQKRFGVALRVPNPDFPATGTVNIHTQQIPDSHGVRHPRYFYTEVTPLTAQLDNEGKLHFSLSEP